MNKKLQGPSGSPLSRVLLLALCALSLFLPRWPAVHSALREALDVFTPMANPDFKAGKDV